MVKAKAAGELPTIHDMLLLHGGPEAVEAWDGAAEHLRRSIPGRQAAELRAFYQHNLDHQHRVESARAVFQFMLAKKRPAMYSLEAELCRSLKDEKFNAADERRTLAYADPKYCDMRQTVEEIAVLDKQLDSLCWRLRNQLNGSN